MGVKQETRDQKSSTWSLFFPPAKRPVSPYSGYNGQLLTSVYQPTEMALMHKGPVSGPSGPCDLARSHRAQPHLLVDRLWGMTSFWRHQPWDVPCTTGITHSPRPRHAGTYL